MERTFGIIGGDRRQSQLAQLLAADGNTVHTCGLGGPIDEESLARAAGAEIVVLPLPLCKGDGVLNCPEGPIPTLDLFRRLGGGRKVLAGQVKPPQRREAELCGVDLEDLFLREELTVSNAAATAEAALQVAMEHLEETLLGMDCLVLGFGRIGKLLSFRLHGLGARVSAAARKPEDRAWIRAYGWQALEFPSLAEALPSFGAVFNTVPAPVLDDALLSRLPKGCLCVDLASRPGIDAASSEALGLKTVWARSLPGRMVPRTAALALRDAIYHAVGP